MRNTHRRTELGEKNTGSAIDKLLYRCLRDMEVTGLRWKSYVAALETIRENCA